MSFQGDKGGTVFATPNSSCVIEGGCQNTSLIGAEDRAGYNVSMTLEFRERGPTLGRPEPGGAVGRTSDDTLPIRAESGAPEHPRNALL